MTRAQAKELTELIESMQHEAAVEMVKSLIDPREDELRFTLVRDGHITEARVIEPKPGEVEKAIADEVVQWSKQTPGLKEVKAYRSTSHGIYEPFTTARRK